MGGTVMKRIVIAAAAVAVFAGMSACEAAEKSAAVDQKPAATTGQAKADKEPAKSEPTLTAGQKNAVKSAENYLDHTAFSKTGLVEQLEYEEFAAKDARFAVDSLAVDWKEQAALSAANYLENMSFSKSGLIEQLEYEGFTAAEAKYGAEKAYK